MRQAQLEVLSFCLLLLQPPIVSCLLLRSVSVPPFSLSGEDAKLHCDFDAQGEQVYSVKWYKGGQEIFRFLPSHPVSPISVYSRAGVIIDQVNQIVGKIRHLKYPMKLV